MVAQTDGKRDGNGTRERLERERSERTEASGVGQIDMN